MGVWGLGAPRKQRHEPDTKRSLSRPFCPLSTPLATLPPPPVYLAYTDAMATPTQPRRLPPGILAAARRVASARKSALNWGWSGGNVRPTATSARSANSFGVPWYVAHKRATLWDVGWTGGGGGRVVGMLQLSRCLAHESHEQVGYHPPPAPTHTPTPLPSPLTLHTHVRGRLEARVR